MPIDDRTSTQNYPKPNIANTLADDVGRLRTALDDIDTDIDALAPKASPVFTGTAAIPVGSNSAPSLYFTGDPNTGLYSPGADQVALATSGTGRLFIDATGNVGIGTTTPGTPLHVAGITRIGANDASDANLEIGAGATENRNAYIDLVGDTTYTDFGARLIRGNTGANASTVLSHRGTGELSIQTTDAAPLTLYTTNTERARIDSSGRLGLGTSNPGSVLDARAAGSNAALSLQETASYGVIWKFDIGTSNELAISNNAVGNLPIVFKPGPAEVARIDSSGRLLVGTSSARVAGEGFQTDVGSQLFIEQPSSGLTPATFLVNRTDANGPRVVIGRSRGASIGSVTIVQAEDGLGAINFAGADGTDLDTIAAQIAVFVDGTPGANDMPGRLVFSTTADGASSPTERLRITSAGVLQVADAGNISVGTTTGTKIGTATTQKLGFFDKTPVVQPTAVADATDAASVITQLNALLARMRDLGLIAT